MRKGRIKPTASGIVDSWTIRTDVLTSEEKIMSRGVNHLLASLDAPTRLRLSTGAPDQGPP